MNDKYVTAFLLLIMMGISLYEVYFLWFSINPHYTIKIENPRHSRVLFVEDEYAKMYRVEQPPKSGCESDSSDRIETDNYPIVGEIDHDTTYPTKQAKRIKVYRADGSIDIALFYQTYFITHPCIFTGDVMLAPIN